MATELDFNQLGSICHQLVNPRKMAIIQYLHMAKFATASVIVRKCGIKQPSVSRYLKALTCDAELLVKEKVGSSIIYQLNAPVWNQITILLSKLAT